MVIFSHLTCDIEGINTVFHHFEKEEVRRKESRGGGRRAGEEGRVRRKDSGWGRGKRGRGGGVRRENGEWGRGWWGCGVSG
ncbi:hypothetical protein [Dermabacter hominis]|uniref:hypothetical protein n=1 Tax=Dermabacter hominis TaxID=36740 RepID=UPI0021A5FCEC|nr:hypothetical protein [Dermabacter hominis]MCT1709537.1 hypothetical protein [Dermabacter hominis]MCT1807488.1 hypothetical protein [Dermabacter hominis]